MPAKDHTAGTTSSWSPAVSILRGASRAVRQFRFASESLRCGIVLILFFMVIAEFQRDILVLKHEITLVFTLMNCFYLSNHMVLLLKLWIVRNTKAHFD